MSIISDYITKRDTILKCIESDILDYNKDEFWLVEPQYERIEFYAARKGLFNAGAALAIARGLHDGTHRKSVLERDGVLYKQPYLVHPLSVAELLIDLRLPLQREEEDILLASAMCHDIIEDIPFENHGTEIYEKFGLDRKIYDTVKKVSKRKDFTEEEEKAFFHGIEDDRLALLIKLSDRCNNVEDLYNMKVWKVHEYVGETRKRYLPMLEYGRVHYPELKFSLEILKDKICSLTDAADILADRYRLKEEELAGELEKLKTENRILRSKWQTLWNAEEVNADER